MIEDFPKTQTRKKLSLLNYVILILIAIMTLLLLYFDKGPLLPPFPDNFYSIDCDDSSFSSYHDGSGFFDFYFNVKPSLEYPSEYLPNFLSVSIKTGPVTMKYSGDDFINLTRFGNVIYSTVAHPFGGTTIINTHCLRKQNGYLEIDLKNPKKREEQYSTSFNPLTDNAVFEDVCLEHQKFLFFTKTMGERPSVKCADGDLRFEFLKWPIKDYLSHKNVSRNNETIFFLTPYSTDIWNSILFWLNPIANSIKNHYESTNPLHFIFRSAVPKDAPKLLEPFTKNAPGLLKDIMCFKKLIITSTDFNVPISDHSRITQALNASFEHLKSVYVRQSPVLPNIALPDTLSSLKEVIEQSIPNASVVLFNHRMAIKEIADIVGHSSILIGNHISNLIHMIWMKSNESMVIDLSSKEYSCNPWASLLSNKMGISYTSHNNNKCSCSGFSCYPAFPRPLDIDHTIIVDAIKKVYPSV